MEVADKRQIAYSNADVNFDNICKYIATAPLMEAKLRDAIPLIQAAIDNMELNINEGGFALEGEQELLNKMKEWMDD